MSSPTLTPAKLARNLRQRRRGEPAPDTQRKTLLLLRADAHTTSPTSKLAIKKAVALAGETGVVVVQVLRLHGSAWGLPNPGLMPNLRERTAADTRVADAVASLRRAGVDADGEILITRNDTKGVCRIATRRSVSNIVVETRTSGTVRAFIEGDIAKSLRRRLGSDVAVESVTVP
jgi:hypothetical protein